MILEVDSKTESPILVTGAAGNVGGVGRTVVELLRQRGLPVRALVHREDERAARLRATGAEIVVGDLTVPPDVVRAMEGCRRIYFGMSASAPYLEATVIAAAVARQRGAIEAFVNISQMTVSQMSLTKMTNSPQHKQQYLAEQVLNWSGLPVVHVRPTAFLENPLFLNLAARSIARNDTIRLPFGTGRTSPVAAQDVAEVMATILANPAAHIGKIYELTGPKSQDMTGVAAEDPAALGREISYVDVPLEEWRDTELRVSTCRSTSLRTYSRWRVFMPPTVMIASRMTLRRSREGRRQVSATLSRAGPTCSRQDASPKSGHPAYAICHIGGLHAATSDRSPGASPHSRSGAECLVHTLRATLRSRSVQSISWVMHPFKQSVTFPGWWEIDLDLLGLVDGDYEYEFVANGMTAAPTPMPIRSPVSGDIAGSSPLRVANGCRNPSAGWRDTCRNQPASKQPDCYLRDADQMDVLGSR